MVKQTIPQLQIWLALARGRVALFRGRIDDARRWFIEARAVAERARFTTGLRMALTGLAVCAAHLGDRDTARAAARAMADLQPDHGFLWPERRLGAAWAAFAVDDQDTAVAELIAGADEAASSRELILEAELLYEAARFGAHEQVARRLTALAGQVDGPLMAARVAFTQGAATHDHTRLANAETLFADVGAHLAAAESAAEFSRELQAKGRTRDSRAAAARSTQYRSGLVAVITPRLLDPTTHPRLSQRQHQITDLAAAGLASKTIAHRLGLSVRTVSNHLQTAYEKLGVAGRDGLAEALHRYHRSAFDERVGYSLAGAARSCRTRSFGRPTIAVSPRTTTGRCNNCLCLTSRAITCSGVSASASVRPSLAHMLSRRTSAVGGSTSLAMISASAAASGGVLM